MTREEKAQFCIDHPSEYPAFQFYPDNWFGSRHVTAMTIEQRGIHASLIFAAWMEKNCGIPENEVCLSARIPNETNWLFLVTSCWFKYKGFLFNERLLKERIKLINLSKIRKEAGIEGGRPIKSKTYKKKPIDNQKDSKSKPIDNQIDNDIDNEIEDIKEDEDKKENPSQIIYSLYPRKKGHRAAIDKITLALKKVPFEELKQKVIEYAESVKDKEQKFIPMPATWFYQERWNDPIEKDQPPPHPYEKLA